MTNIFLEISLYFVYSHSDYQHIVEKTAIKITCIYITDIVIFKRKG